MEGRTGGGGSVNAINYFIAQRYVDAFAKLAESPNQKTVIVPAEMSALVGALGDEIVDGVDAAALDGVGDHLGGLGFGLRRPFARFGVEEGGGPAALGLQHGGLLGAFGSGDGGLLLALGLGDHRPALAFGFHLPGHGVGDVGGGLQVLDLDPRDLHPPGAGGVVDHVQQAGVDLVALGQHLVQVHGADDGAQVGHHQLGDGAVQV